MRTFKYRLNRFFELASGEAEDRFYWCAKHTESIREKMRIRLPFRPINFDRQNRTSIAAEIFPAHKTPFPVWREYDPRLMNIY